MRSKTGLLKRLLRKGVLSCLFVYSSVFVESLGLQNRRPEKGAKSNANSKRCTQKAPTNSFRGIDVRRGRGTVRGLESTHEQFHGHRRWP